MDENLNIKQRYETKSIVNFFSVDKELQLPEEAIINKYQAAIRNRAILDIGCGTGRTTEPLSKMSAEYIGIDYSSEMLKSCRKQYQDLTFACCDVRDMAMFADNRFDFVIFSFNGIDGIPHAGRIRGLEEIRRVLKPDGIFTFSSHNLNYKELPFKAPEVFSTLEPLPFLRNFMKRLRYMKNKSQEIYTDDYAILNWPTFSYRCFIYCIKKNKQIEQLSDVGFREIEIVNLKGEFIDVGAPDHEDRWLYYVCRK